MARLVAILCLLGALSTVIVVDGKVEADVTKLQIGVKFRPAVCDVKAHKDDSVELHYRGFLTDGTQFDSSLDRGAAPFAFKLGNQMVIKGWDIGVTGMCLGEKRKLKIPSDLGYGDTGSPPKIPGGATLIFEVQLLGVNGKMYKEPEEDKEATKDL